jgi:hypothetical protein
MPRYYFHVVEAQSLRTSLRDGEGLVLSDATAAKKEALGLAQDIVTHGVHGSGEWKVVVTDEHGDDILTVPLSEVRARRNSPWRKLRSLVSGFVFRSQRTFVWSIVAGAIVVQGIIAIMLFRDTGTYEIASAPAESAVVSVRFVAQASAHEITTFLETYKSSIVEGPRAGGFYRIRVSETPLLQEELREMAARMGQEKVVDFIAVPQ